MVAKLGRGYCPFRFPKRWAGAGAVGLKPEFYDVPGGLFAGGHAVILRAPGAAGAEFPAEDSGKPGLGGKGRREGVVGLGLEMDCSRYRREHPKRDAFKLFAVVGGVGEGALGGTG